MTRFPIFTALVSLALAPPAAAQDLGALGDSAEGTVFDGDWLSVGLGVGLVPSYDGSDDYVVTPVPLVQGSIGGIGINPRAGGLALDFVPDPDEGLGLSLGPAFRLRTNRARQIKDPVVEGLGKLDAAVEIGPSAGITIPKLLHGYDSLSFGLDVRWDVAGAHDGMVANPSITYFTPLSRGAAISFSLDAERADGDFMDYYYSVSPAASVASGLTPFTADGGWYRAGGYLLGGLDLNGDLADGGLAAFAVVGYSRMLGDARRSPFTAERGRPSQFQAAIGLGYTF